MVQFVKKQGIFTSSKLCEHCVIYHIFWEIISVCHANCIELEKPKFIFQFWEKILKEKKTFVLMVIASKSLVSMIECTLCILTLYLYYYIIDI